MKVKKVIITLCTLMSITMICGCSASQEDSKKSQDMESNFSSEVPDSLRQKIQDSLDSVPISIPADDWTTETLCQAISINGTPIAIPCTLRDLGDGFAIQQSEEFPIAINELNHRATAPVEYFGKYLGSVVVTDCNSEDEILDSPIYYLFLSFDVLYDTGISPIAINGIGIEGTPEMQQKHLYFMELQSKDETNEFYSYKIEIENTALTCTYKDNKLKDVTIRLQDLNE